MSDSFSAREPSLSGTVNARNPSISGGGERQRRGPSVGATAAPRPSVIAEGRSRSTLASVRESSQQFSGRLRRAQAHARSHLFWTRATQRIHEEQQRLNSDCSAPEVVRILVISYTTLPMRVVTGYNDLDRMWL